MIISAVEEDGEQEGSVAYGKWNCGNFRQGNEERAH